MSDHSFMSRCSRFLKALSDLNRLKILELLFKNELCVSDIVKALKIDQPKVSHHLSILKAAGIVLNRRNGRTIIYSLHPAVAKKSEHMGKIDTGFCSVEFRFRHKKEPGDTKEKEMQ